MIRTTQEEGYIRHYFIGDVDAAQVREWHATLDMSVETTNGELYVFIDYSKVKSVSKEAMDLIIEIQKEAKNAGLVRVAVVEVAVAVVL